MVISELNLDEATEFYNGRLICITMKPPIMFFIFIFLGFLFVYPSFLEFIFDVFVCLIIFMYLIKSWESKRFMLNWLFR